MARAESAGDFGARRLIRDIPEVLIRTIANANMGRAGITPLWFGESDRPTAAPIREAAAESLARGETFYSANLGLAELRGALSAYQARLFGGADIPERVAVTGSGLNALNLVNTALISPGDEVIVPEPAWPNLMAIPQMLGARVVPVPLRLVDGRFRLDLDDIAARIGPKTRMVVINSPHNPTGWNMPPEDQAALVAMLSARGIWLLADEVYGRLVAKGVAPSFLPYVADDARVVVVNSFSKTWAMTGWRMGWITAPRALIGDIEKLIELNTSCVPVFVQRAGLAALRLGEPFIEEQRTRLAVGRRVVAETLGAHPSVEMPVLDATFYAFPRLSVDDDLAFVLRAIEEAGVGLAPGRAFGDGGRGHIRLCYARDEDVLRAACTRVAALL